MDAETVELLQAAKRMLTQHHRWHLDQNWPDEHGTILSEAYADSDLYDGTDDVLNGLEQATQGLSPTAPAKLGLVQAVTEWAEDHVSREDSFTDAERAQYIAGARAMARSILKDDGGIMLDRCISGLGAAHAYLYGALQSISVITDMSRDSV